MGTRENDCRTPPLENIGRSNKIGSSSESLNSVFEDNPQTYYNNCPSSKKRDDVKFRDSGIRIHFSEYLDPNEGHIQRANSIGCIPVTNEDSHIKYKRSLSNNLVQRDNEANHDMFRSSSFSGPRDISTKQLLNISNSQCSSKQHLNLQQTVLPYFITDCSCLLDVPQGNFSNNLSPGCGLYKVGSTSSLAKARSSRKYSARSSVAGDSIDSGIINIRSNENENSFESKSKPISTSAPSSARNSFRKKEKKSKSISEFDGKFCGHSSRINSAYSLEDAEIEMGEEMPTDKNAMVFHLVLPQLSNGNMNSSCRSMNMRTESRSSSIEIEDGMIEEPESIISKDNKSHRQGNGKAFHQLAEGSQTISERNSVSNISACPTNEESKKKFLKKWLSVIISCIYGTFLVMLGLVIYVAELFYFGTKIEQIFNLFLIVAGICWLCFFHIDIRYFINSSKKFKLDATKLTEGSENNSVISLAQGQVSSPEPNDRPHHYCFMTGRHSGSFFLKIGAAGFCFGHLIHQGLLLSRQIVYFTSDDEYKEPCANKTTLILDLLHLIFSFYQLFMIFKYSNVVIRRFCEVSRFALMHIIAADICFWIHTIIRETIESIQSKSRAAGVEDNDTSTNSSFTKDCPDAILGSLSSNDLCVSEPVLSAFTLKAAPYLYPFTIEYSLLIAGVWFIIWFNVDNSDNCCDRGKLTGTCNIPGVDCKEDFSSNLVIHVDCHSANRGLFAGLLVLLATVVSVIVFFVAMMDPEYVRTGMIINTTSDILLLLTMCLVTVFAYRQTSKLDINNHAITFLDDILLFIALPCFFLYGIFTIVADARDLSTPFSIVASILAVLQVILQTPFIIDGLRRCSNSQTLRYQKPGRELITFLIVCNLAMWLLETFEIKSSEVHYDQSKYYGKYVWTILSHITLPLTLFYRFHSSVCLVDIWKSAYEAGD